MEEKTEKKIVKVIEVHCCDLCPYYEAPNFCEHIYDDIEFAEGEGPRTMVGTNCELNDRMEGE